MGEKKDKEMEQWSKNMFFVFNLNLIGIVISRDDEFYGMTMRKIGRWKGGRRFMK